MRNDINNYPGVVLGLYSKHYENPRLEKEARLVRRFIILTITIPFIGFIFTFLPALHIL